MATFDNEIAMVRMSQRIQFPPDNTVAPICWPKTNEMYKDGISAIAAGWERNASATLKEVIN